ncbi:MAG: lipoyl(octanoyl) transferase, partial [Limnospira maxima]
MGLISYQQAWRWQQDLEADRIKCPNLEDIYHILAHPPVYTLGQRARADYLTIHPPKSEYELYRVERGGEVTYHC